MPVFWNLFSFSEEYKIWDFPNALRDKDKQTEIKIITQTEADPDTQGQIYIKVFLEKNKSHNKIKQTKQNIKAFGTFQ